MAADSAIAATRTQTRAQAYARFKKVFANRPGLVGAVPPDSLPPVVWARPRTDDWGTFPALRQRLAAAAHAQRVDVQPRNEREVADCRRRFGRQPHGR